MSSVGVWAVDHQGRIHVRKEITATFPEGTHWQTIEADPPILNSVPDTTGFKHVSLGHSSSEGDHQRRRYSKKRGDMSWKPCSIRLELGISGNWQHVTVRAFN